MVSVGLFEIAVLGCPQNVSPKFHTFISRNRLFLSTDESMKVGAYVVRTTQYSYSLYYPLLTFLKPGSLLVNLPWTRSTVSMSCLRLGDHEGSIVRIAILDLDCATHGVAQ